MKERDRVGRTEEAADAPRATPVRASAERATAVGGNAKNVVAGDGSPRVDPCSGGRTARRALGAGAPGGGTAPVRHTRPGMALPPGHHRRPARPRRPRHRRGNTGGRGAPPGTAGLLRPRCGIRVLEPAARPRHPGVRDLRSYGVRYDHRIHIPRSRLLFRRVRGRRAGPRAEPGPRPRGVRPGCAETYRLAAAVAVPAGDAGAATGGGARGPGGLGAVLAGGRCPHRRSAGGARRAPPAAARQHPQDSLRHHRAAGAARRHPAHRQGGGAGGDRARQQPGRGHRGAHLPRGRPVARGLPALRQRRGARAVRDERRLAHHSPPDAGQGPRARRPRHARRLARRLRHAGPGVVGVRPGGLRPGRAAQRGLRALLLHRRGQVPR